MIERAKTGDLADGSSATCSELDALIAVDRDAIEFEKDKVDARFGNDKAKVQATEDTLQAQVDNLRRSARTRAALPRRPTSIRLLISRCTSAPTGAFSTRRV